MSTASTRGERSSSASSMRSKGRVSASGSRSSGQTRASSRIRRSPPAAPGAPRPRSAAARPASASSGSMRRPSPNHRSSSAEPPASAQRWRSTVACTRWPTRSRPTASQADRCSATRTPATAPTTARAGRRQHERRGGSRRAPAASRADPARADPARPAPRGRGRARRSGPTGRARRRARSPRRVARSRHEKPFQADPEARGDGRVEGAVEVEPGRQATGRLCGGQRASASDVAPPPRGASSSASAPRGQPPVPPADQPCGIERRLAGRDRRARALQHRLRLAPPTQRQPAGAERLEGDGEGRIGPRHRTQHDRTDVLFREAPGPAILAGWPWGCSSAGRAPRSHRGGQGFESPHLHHPTHFEFGRLRRAGHASSPHALVRPTARGCRTAASSDRPESARRTWSRSGRLEHSRRASERTSALCIHGSVGVADGHHWHRRRDPSHASTDFAMHGEVG